MIKEITFVPKDRRQLLMLFTKAWVEEKNGNRILDKETKTHVREIYMDAEENIVKKFNRNDLTVRKPPVIKKIRMPREKNDDDDFDF